jgi:hypothetical protein
MSCDIAEEIVKKASQKCHQRFLHIELHVCHDHQDPVDMSRPLETSKTYAYFRNIPFQINPHIGSLNFTMMPDESVIYEGFSFTGLEDTLKMLIYQFIFHAQYIEDITSCEIVVLNISEKNHKISFCFPINLQEIPITELDSISTEVLDKVLEPIQTVFNSWKNSCKSL